MTEKSNIENLIVDYLAKLDNHKFEEAGKHLASEIKIKGPAGEAFTSITDFLNMLEKQNGRYHIKKIFVDRDDVAVFYDFKASNVTAFMASWYHVKNNKIDSIQTIFDSKLFS